MWAVKLIYGQKFTAKNMKEYGKVGVVFSGTNYTESGMVFVTKKEIQSAKRITK